MPRTSSVFFHILNEDWWKNVTTTYDNIYTITFYNRKKMLNCFIYLIIHYLLFVMPVMLTLILIFLLLFFMIIIIICHLVCENLWPPAFFVAKHFFQFWGSLSNAVMHPCVVCFKRAPATDTKPVSSYSSVLLHLNAFYQQLTDVTDYKICFWYLADKRAASGAVSRRFWEGPLWWEVYDSYSS